MSADVHPAPRGWALKVGRRSLLIVLAAGPTPVLRGMAFATGSGVDPRSPVFRQAAAACGLGGVP